MQDADYQRIERAINYLRDNSRDQPGLEELAEHCGLSSYHFQRLFRRWAGVSPKQFLQYLTVQHAKALIEQSTPTLDACFEVGLSSPGRLHDHFVTVEAVTPGEARRLGDGLEIFWGLIDSPFGRAFAGVTERGICALEFIGDTPAEDAADRLRERWPNATISPHQDEVEKRTAGVFESGPQSTELKLLVRGTNFQVQVWRALLQIPAGHLCSYGQLADYLGKPSATRAVASAIGANAIAYLIPCHRVLRAGGELGGYRWGLGRKQAMLAKEQCTASAPVARTGELAFTA